MPNTPSAKKRLRQNDARRLRNRIAKSVIRGHIRKVLEAVQADQIEQAEQEYRQAARKLDRAGSKHIIHRNTAARKKSRLQRIIKSAKQNAQPST